MPLRISRANCEFVIPLREISLPARKHPRPMAARSL
jgi:hypothetical protein